MVPIFQSTPVQPAPQPNEVNADAPVEAAPQPNEVNPDAFTHLACGFCLDYSKAYEMFQAVCRRSPRTARNVASEITPLVTFPVDSCRFWMVVVDIKVCFQKKCIWFQGALQVQAKQGVTSQMEKSK